MNATFIDSLRATAQTWYNEIPYETDSGGTEFSVGTVRVLTRGRRGGRMTLESLLEAIVAAAAGPGSLHTIVTVHHGSDEGIGIPLLNGARASQVGANRQHLGMLSGTRQINGEPIRPLSGDSPATDQELSRAWRPYGGSITEARIAELRSLMVQVQRLQIQRLQIRACNIGSSEETMREIGSFFGIPHVCAPRSRDAFGPTRRIEVVGSANQLSARIRTGGPWAPYAAVDGIPRVYLHAVSGARALSVSGLSRSRDYVGDWMTRTFRAGGAFQPTPAFIQRAVTRGVPIHGVWVQPGGAMTSVPGAQHYGGGLLLPGMNEYANNLRAITVNISSPSP